MGWFSRLFGWKEPKTPPTDTSQTDVIGPSIVQQEKIFPTFSIPEEDGNDDEGKMIAKLKIHRKMKNLLIERLKMEGIDCTATTNNDPNGDILVIRKRDVPRVKEIIRSLN